MSAIDEYLQQILDAVYGEEVRGAIHDAILQTYEDGLAGVPRSRTINGHDLRSDIVLTASDVGAVPTTRKVNDKALSQDITLAATDVGAVPTTRKVNDKVLSQDITLAASDVGAVPTTRKVNDKALSQDITLAASDVGAVPTTRKVNNKALSQDITLAASDVGAVPISGGTMTGLLTLSDAPTSNMHAATKKYVDDAVAAGGGGGGGGGDYVPITRTVNGKALSTDISLTASDVGAVPTTRTVNSKALSANISLTASDVGAVPTTRTVNSKALSANISLTASDVSAVPLAGGTMTGQLVLSSSGYKTSAANGYYTNQYGNFIHSDTTTTSSWNIQKNDGTPVFTINFESGATTMPGQLCLSKTTDVSGSASSEGALVIGTKTGEHLAVDTNEIMAKTSATAVGPLNLNYDGGNILMGVNNTSYYVQIRSTAGSTSTTSGALRVGGGVGVGGAVYANGLVEGAELRSHHTSWPCVQFTNTVAGSTMGQIHLTISSRVMTFREVTTSGNTIYEDFSLPAPTITSGTRSYNILTTKSVYYAASLPSSGTNGDICLVPV